MHSPIFFPTPFAGEETSSEAFSALPEVTQLQQMQLGFPPGLCGSIYLPSAPLGPSPMLDA